MSTIAEERWLHLKNRARREGVPFELSPTAFDSIIDYIEPEKLFPDRTFLDRVRWSLRKLLA